MKYLILSLFSLVAFFSLAQDCGLKGSLEERIKDCNSGGAHSVLVYRQDNKKILMDVYSKKLFAAPFDNSQTFYEGITKCQLAFNNLVELRDRYEWRMSKTYELHTSFIHHIFRQLSKPYKNYWGLPGKNFWMHKAYVFEVIDSGAYSTGSYIKLGHEVGRERYLKRQVICVGLPVL